MRQTRRALLRLALFKHGLKADGGGGMAGMIRATPRGDAMDEGDEYAGDSGRSRRAAVSSTAMEP